MNRFPKRQLTQRLSLVIMVAVVCLFFIPSPVAAQGVLGLAVDFQINSLLEGGITITTMLLQAAGWALLQLSNAFAIISNLQITSSNVVVFDAWEIARDITNLFFIVGMVVISFATIFRATGLGFLRQFYWKTALPKLLIAAILVNLSLGLSESVMLISNRVTTMLAGVIANSSARITNIMQAGILLTNGTAITSPEIASRNLGKNFELKAPDGTDLDTYLAIAENRSVQEEEAFQICINEEKELGFFESWFNDPVRKSVGDCVQELAMARRGETDVSFSDRAAYEFLANNVPTGLLSLLNSPTQRATLLIAGLFNVALMVLLIVSLATAVAFFAFRIIALWALMFMSAFAFGLFWINGDILKNWWRYFLGWNVFGPLYMLILLFGLTFLARQGDLMASLGQVGGIGLGSVLISTVFFFMMAAVIFIGGLNWALHHSFAQAVRSTPVIGELTARFGAFSAISASQAVGKRLGQVSGVTPTYQAARERAEQTYQAVSQRISPVSDEGRLARARTRLGVYRGAPELLTERIKAQRATLEGQASAIPDRTRQEAFLREQMSSRDRGTALAAGQVLLSKGKAGAQDIEQMQKLYPGGIAQAEFSKSLRDTKVAAANPQAIFDYRKQEIGKKDPERDRKLENLQNEVFSSVLKNPNALAGLGKAYFELGTKEYEGLKKTIDRQFPEGDTKARAKAYNRFVKVSKSAQQDQALRELFKQGAGGGDAQASPPPPPTPGGRAPRRNNT